MKNYQKPQLILIDVQVEDSILNGTATGNQHSDGSVVEATNQKSAPADGMGIDWSE
ncbi:MAG: hypothetical protein HUK09_07010 [Bacteroidaceae bacterium]|nr:hypothetical protein [Bacteroidaceae bacterium]